MSSLPLACRTPQAAISNQTLAWSLALVNDLTVKGSRNPQRIMTSCWVFYKDRAS